MEPLPSPIPFIAKLNTLAVNALAPSSITTGNIQWNGTSWTVTTAAPNPMQMNDCTRTTPITPTDITYGNLYKKPNDTGLYWTTSVGNEVNLSPGNSVRGPNSAVLGNLAIYSDTTGHNITTSNIKITGGVLDLASNLINNLGNGSTSSLGLGFANNTGLYSSASSNLDIAVSGTRVLNVSSTGVLSSTLGAYESLLSTGNQLVNKQYVDNFLSGLSVKSSCIVRTTTLLPSYITAGSGSTKTITAVSNGLFPSIDGYTVSAGDRIFVDSTGVTSSVDTGIYTVTSMGSASTTWRLTRSIDFNNSNSVTSGSFVFVAEGTLSGGRGYVLITPPPIVIDVTNLSWTQFSTVGDNLGNHTATQSLNLSNNVLLNVSSGSLSTPSISFNNSSDTGIYSSVLDQVDIVTNGSLGLSISPTLITQGLSVSTYAANVLADSIGSSIPNKLYITNSQGYNLDSTFRISNLADSSKKISFDLSNLSTSITRSITVPNNNSTLVAIPNSTSIASGNTSYVLPAIRGTLYGIGAGSSLSTGSIGITAIGYQALTSNTTGYYNTAIGSSSLNNLTTGLRNTAIGYSSGTSINANDNVAIGQGAMSGVYINTGGLNVAIGSLAFPTNYNDIVSAYNTIVGASSASLVTGGTGYNTVIGASSGNTISTGNNNTILGSSSTVNTGSDAYSIVIGSNVTGSAASSQANPVITIGGTTSVTNNLLYIPKLGATSTGNILFYNSATGQITYNSAPVQSPVTTSSFNTNTTGGTGAMNTLNSTSTNVLRNTGFGNNVLYSITDLAVNSDNTALGNSVLYNANATSGTTLANTAIGSKAMFSSTTGYNNATLGYQTLYTSTTSYNNVAIGYKSLYSNLVGNSNITIGYQSGYNATGSNNILIGSSADTSAGISSALVLGNVSATSSNSFKIDTGFFNGVSPTSSMLYYNTSTGLVTYGNLPQTGVSSFGTGSPVTSNTPAGTNALGTLNLAAVNALRNTAMGSLANYTLSDNALNSDNTSFGYKALYLSNTTSGSILANTAIGSLSLAAATTGFNNIALGYNTGSSLTTGSNNILIGNSANTGAAYTYSLVIGPSTGPSSNSFTIHPNYVSTATSATSIYYNTSTGLVTYGTSSIISNNLNITSITSAPSLLNSTLATKNTTIGYTAGNALTDNALNSDNTAIGYKSLFTANTTSGTALSSTAVGSLALTLSTTGYQNTALGASSLAITTTGFNNTALGYNTGSSLTTGSNNILIGNSANTGAALTYTLVLGPSTASASNSFIVNTNYVSTATTSNLLYYNTSTGLITYGVAAIPSSYASYNTNTSAGTGAISVLNGTSTSAVHNTALGNLSLNTLTDTTFNSDNTAIGYKALFASSNTATNITKSTAIGSLSLATVTTGYNNTAIGYNTGSSLTTGANNILIGNNANTGAALNYTLVIGAMTASASNSIMIDSNYLTSAVTSNCLFYNTSNGTVTYGTAGVVSFGIATPAGSNTSAGTSALGTLNNAATNAVRNTAFGKSALAAATDNVATADNTAFGYLALAGNTSGNQNTAIGSNVLKIATTSSSNTAIGYNSMAAATTSSSNTAIGYNTLAAATTVGTHTAVGYNALNANTSGTNNLAVGCYALNVNTTGSNNVAIGYNSLAANIGNSGNTAVGYSSLAASTGGLNTAFGFNVLATTNSGQYNVGMGTSAGFSNTTGSYNVAIGGSALYTNTTSSNSLAIGYNSLTLATGAGNTAIGYSSLATVSTGAGNIAIGTSVGASLTTGSNNILIGNSANTGAALSNTLVIGPSTASASNTFVVNTAFVSNASSANSLFYDSSTGLVSYSTAGVVSFGSNTPTTSNTAAGTSAMSTLNGAATLALRNTAFGKSALSAATNSSSTNDNTAVGYFALNANTSGNANTSFGSNVLKACTTGQYNTAMGTTSQTLVTTGTYNTSYGYNSLPAVTINSCNTAFGGNSLANNTASNLTAIGYAALYNNTSGLGNTGLGYYTLFTNVTGANNTGLGYQALTLATGSNNTAVGYNSLSAITTGANNTTLGNSTGLLLTTGSDNIIIGNSVNTTAIGTSNALIIGKSGTTAASNTTVIDPSYVSTAVTSNVMYYNSTSGLVSYGAAPVTGIPSYGSGTPSTSNTAAGTSALGTLNGTAASALRNTAFGKSALTAATDSASTIDNTAFGYTALLANTTGAGNTAIGSTSSILVTTGANNTAVGSNTLKAVTTGSNNTAIGGNSLTIANNANCTAVGYNAASNNTASNITAVGYAALANNTALGCTAVGCQALSTNTTGVNNTAIGYQSMTSSNSSNNTAIGYYTLANLTTGYSNTAIGTATGTSITSGMRNILIGGSADSAYYDSLVIGASTAPSANSMTINAAYISSGFANNILYYDFPSGLVTRGAYPGVTSFGATSANSTTITNTASGSGALGVMNRVAATAIKNTAFGRNALAIATDVSGTTDNTAIGFLTLSALTSGIGNTALGSLAGISCTTSANCTFLGNNTGFSNTTGASNTAVGMNSMYSNTTPSYNTAIGQSTLYYNVTGTGNNAVGYSALLNTTGDNNIGIGNTVGVTLTTGTSNILIGNSADVSAAGDISAIVIGHGVVSPAASTSANPVITIGRSTATTNSLYIPKLSNVSTSNLVYYNSSTGLITYAAAPSITGTTNQVIATPSGINYTLSLPQSIATTSSPTFATLTASTKILVNTTGISSSTDSCQVVGATLIADNSTPTGVLKLGAGSAITYIESGSSTTSGSVASLYFTSMNASNIWMTLSTTGLLGINTTNPSVGIDVRAPGTATGMTSTYGSFGGGGSGTAANVYLFNQSPGIGFNMSSSSGFYYGTGSSANYGGAINFLPTTGLMQFYTTAATGSAATAATAAVAMSIDKNGKVGINDSAQTSTLSVVGNAQIGFASATTAPTNGLAVSGQVLLGTSSATTGTYASIGNISGYANLLNINGTTTSTVACISTTDQFGSYINTNNKVPASTTATWLVQQILSNKVDFSNSTTAATNSAGLYIAAGSQTGGTTSGGSASVTNAYGIYVNIPTYGTNRLTGYFGGQTFFAIDSSAVAPGQLAAVGAGTTSKQLLIGYNTTANTTGSGYGYGSIQAIYQGNSVTPVILNPVGGNVGVGTNTNPQYGLEVTGTFRVTSTSLFSADTTVSTKLIAGGSTASTGTPSGTFYQGTFGNIGLAITGQEYYATSNTSTEGIALIAGVNRSSNRQLWLADTARLAVNSTNPVIRLSLGGSAVIDAIATNGTNVLPLYIGNTQSTTTVQGALTSGDFSCSGKTTTNQLQLLNNPTPGAIMTSDASGNGTWRTYTPGSGSLLAITSYNGNNALTTNGNSGTNPSYTLSSTTITDIDAVNLSLTFTVPASGNVYVLFSAPMYASTSQNTFVCLRDSANTLLGTSVLSSNANSLQHCSYSVTGLSAGVKTFKMSYYAPTGGNLCIPYGGTYGKVFFAIYDGTTSGLGGASVYNNPLLGIQGYAQSSNGQYTCSSITVADVDSTNLIVTFTAPASGNITVTVNGTFQVTSGYLYLCIREGSTILATSATLYNNTTTFQSIPFYITGITSGVHTYKLSWYISAAVSSTAGTGTIGSGPAYLFNGPTYGKTTLSVNDATTGVGGQGSAASGIYTTTASTVVATAGGIFTKPFPGVLSLNTANVTISGSTIYVPAGSYTFQLTITTPSTGMAVAIYADGNATINASAYFSTNLVSGWVPISNSSTQVYTCTLNINSYFQICGDAYTSAWTAASQIITFSRNVGSNTAQGGVQTYNETNATNVSPGNGGSANAFTARGINTIGPGNLDGILTSLASNTITIQPGKYFIRASTPAYIPGYHMSALYCTTTSTYVVYGTSEYTTGSSTQTRSELSGYISITVPTSYQVHHALTQSTGSGTNGLGVSAAATGLPAYAAVFATITIQTLNSGSVNTTGSLALGTVTTPTVNFQGSANTGIYASAANKIDFSANSVQQMSIGTAGVNIPTTLSTAAFQMATGAVAGKALITDASGNGTWQTVSSSGGSGAYGGLLGKTTYNGGNAPGTSNTIAGSPGPGNSPNGFWSAATATVVDVDSNLTVTFNAPASGNVVVQFGADIRTTTGGDAFMCIREGSTLLGVSPFGIVNSFFQVFTYYLTGVTAGSHTYKVSWYATSGSNTIYMYYGQVFGQIIFTVYDGTVNALGGSSVYNNPLLGVQAYSAGSNTAYTIASSGTSVVDIDTTNLVTTFIAPSSGNILVTVNGTFQITSGYLYLCIREGSTILGINSLTNTTSNLQSIPFYITGVLAGSHTYKLSWYVSGTVSTTAGTGASTGGTGSLYTGPTYGKASITVNDATTGVGGQGFAASGTFKTTVSTVVATAGGIFTKPFPGVLSLNTSNVNLTGNNTIYVPSGNYTFTLTITTPSSNGGAIAIYADGNATINASAYFSTNLVSGWVPLANNTTQVYTCTLYINGYFQICGDAYTSAWTAASQTISFVRDVGSVSATGGAQTYVESYAFGNGPPQVAVGNWGPRTLNTVRSGLGNIDGILTSLNTTTGCVTVQPGSYLIETSAPSYAGGSHITRLIVNSTGGTNATGTVLATGTTEFCGSDKQTRSFITTYQTFTTPTTILLQHNCSLLATANQGTALAGNNISITETYAMMTISTMNNGSVNSTGSLVAGSVTAPTVNFSGSATTGLYSSGANKLSIAANGIQQMDVSSTGVTIPTSLSTAGLQLTTGGSTGKVLTSDASGIATWQLPTSGNSANGTLLGMTAYAPGSDTGPANATSAGITDIDATNLTVTFIAPASGNVYIIFNASLNAGTSNGFIYLREGSTTLGTSVIGTANNLYLEYSYYITGVTAGSHTYKMSWRGGGTISLNWGPTFGKAILAVYDGTVNSLGGSSIYNNPVLGLQAYSAGSNTSYTIASSGTSVVDVDTTNLVTTFTAPASGNILVTVNGVFQITVGYLYLCIREGSTILGITPLTNTTTTMESIPFYITGVSSGSHTYKLSWYVSGGVSATAGTGTTSTGTGSLFTGPTYGKASIVVTDSTTGVGGQGAAASGTFTTTASTVVATAGGIFTKPFNGALSNYTSNINLTNSNTIYVPAGSYTFQLTITTPASNGGAVAIYVDGSSTINASAYFSTNLVSGWVPLALGTTQIYTCTLNINSYFQICGDAYTASWTAASQVITFNRNVGSVTATGGVQTYMESQASGSTTNAGVLPANAGTFVGNTRHLNSTGLGNLDGILTSLDVPTYTVTIQPGKYMITASAPAFDCNQHQIRLWNVTTSSVVATGTSEYNFANGVSAPYNQTRSHLTAYISITVPTQYIIQHYLNNISGNGTTGTAQDSEGVGLNVAGFTDTYAMMTIQTLNSGGSVNTTGSLIAGTVTTPTVNFQGSATTGIYSSAANKIDFASNGVQQVSISTTGVTMVNPTTLPTGTVSAPAIVFGSNTNTGIYQSATNNVDITANGVRQVNVNSSGVNVPTTLTVGPTAAPSTNTSVDFSSCPLTLLPPKMTTATKNAIIAPPAGGVVYDTTTGGLSVYNGTQWVTYGFVPTTNVAILAAAIGSVAVATSFTLSGSWSASGNVQWNANNQGVSIQINGSAAIGNWFQYNFGTQAAGVYKCRYEFMGYTDRAIVQTTEFSTSTVLRSSLDCYSPNATSIKIEDYFYWAGSGNMQIRWTTTSKNATIPSSNYYMLLENMVDLQRVG